MNNQSIGAIGQLDEEEFKKLYRFMICPNEVKTLFRELTGNSGDLSLQDFTQFLNDVQKVCVSGYIYLYEWVNVTDIFK